MSEAADRRYCGLIVLFVALVYSPCVAAVYGFSDDFTVFFGNSQSFVRWTYANGRPLLGLIRELTLHEVADVRTLSLFRAISLVGIIALSLTFYRRLRTIAEPGESAAFAIGIATLPSIQVFAAWALCMHMPYSAVTAAWAAIGAERAFSAWAESRKAFLAWWFFALGLMLVTSSIYQPSLAWYWTAAIVPVLDRRFRRDAVFRRNVLLTVGSGLVFLAACFVFQKAFFALTQVTPAGRVTLTNDPLSKLYWFMRIQLPLSLNLWNLMNPLSRIQSLAPACLAMLVVVAGICFGGKRRYRISCDSNQQAEGSKWRIISIQVTVLVLLILLTHAHWLLVEASPQNYRVIAALAASCCILVLWSIKEILAVMGMSARAARLVLMTIAILTLFHCQWSLQRYWITPYQLGYRYVVATLREGLTEQTQHIHVIRQGREDGIVSQQRIDNFSIPMSYHPWMIEGLLRAAMKDVRGQSGQIRVTHSATSEPSEIGDDGLLLDMRKLKWFRVNAQP
ncbi:hypothetical protein CA13_56950 [Planctomycetes bacterium CA13]|uniref:Glycosyltransferase RgtA/B/C/D-like domain-containing protein n=1 Tax=Novipirellula herctigrandis TaxID=2527986 RepID=A0A5C5ZA27_9BACT|nr:hypothetical protein CA13_56950 [Planctomycetes bacterium CA13]